MITAHKGDINAQIGVGYKITEKIEGNVKMLYSILSTTTDAKWHNSLSAGLRFYL